MLRSVDIERQIESGRILLQMTSCETFDSIRVLSLRDLALNKVFKHLICCTNLQILFLSGNRIQRQDIKQHMYKLPKLRKLDLSNNELHGLPIEPAFFGHMPALEFFTLDNNAILTTEAISGLAYAKNLKYLSIQNNPIQIQLQQTYRFDVTTTIPHLHALDQNCVTFDEFTYRMENRSIRFCSMNSFTKLDNQTTLVFLPELSASQHQELLNEQLKQMYQKRRFNDPLVCIRMSLREAGVAKVALAILTKTGQSVKVIQRFARGWLVRLRMKKEFLAYFDSIGEIELTMSVEEASRYRATNTLHRQLPNLTQRFRKHKLLKTNATKIGKYVKGSAVRQCLSWAMTGPLNLKDNRYIIVLKEQKYLLKHILLEQKDKITQKHANSLAKLIYDYSDYYMVKHIDLDLFDMPEQAVLQIAMPPTLLSAARAKKRPQSLRDGRTLFELCIPSIGDKSQQQQQLKNLRRLKPEYTNMSSYEIKVGRLEVVPEDFKKKLLKEKRKRQLQLLKSQDALGESSASSDIISNADDQITVTKDNKSEMSDAKDKKLFVEIMRREGQDFVCLDLRKSKSDDLNSEHMMEFLLKTLIRWNRSNEVNQIHFYVGELFKRQVAIIQIQQWFRQVLRTKRERRQLEYQMQQKKRNDLTQVDLQPNQLTILRCLQLRRAAKTIQKYWSMYRLRRRIRMLANLKVYLQGVTSNTLCIEEHLYKNIQLIQCTGHQLENDSVMTSTMNGTSRRNCNTIPEAHCFAFDFIQQKQEEQSREAALGAWDLKYTTDRKYFSSWTNQETHELIYNRFEKVCVPNWVVLDNKELSAKDGEIYTHDRNNTNQIFHKTQESNPTEILDYNQIVASENRTFVMNNGLRFVVIHCASVVDARRRALALAMISLDRAKGDFLKMLCPNQLFSGNFMPNIKNWWDLPAISKQIPKDFYDQLIQPGIQNLRELPLPLKQGYSGLILSEKDHAMAFQEDTVHSVQIQRQRNYDELRMKLVYSVLSQIPKNISITSAAHPTTLLECRIDGVFNRYSEQTHNSNNQRSEISYKDSSQRQLVHFRSTKLSQDGTTVENNLDSFAHVSTDAANLVEDPTVAIEVQALGETSEDNTLSQEAVIMGRNYDHNIQGLSAHVTIDDEFKADNSIIINEEDVANMQTQELVHKSEIQDEKAMNIQFDADVTMTYNPEVQQKIIAQKSKKIFMDKARAVTIKPTENKLDTANQSNFPTKAQMDTTTKADSLFGGAGRQTISSTQIGAESDSIIFTSAGNNSSSILLQKNNRIKSGLNVRMKPALQTQQSSQMLNSSTNIKAAKVMKSQNRRPKTSLAIKSNDYQQSQFRQSKVQQMSQVNVHTSSTLREDILNREDSRIVEESPGLQLNIRKFEGQDIKPYEEIKTIETVKRQDTFRIRSSYLKNKTHTASIRSDSHKRLSEEPLQSSQQNLQISQTTDYCLPSYNMDGMTINVSKKRMVSQLISNSMNTEKKSRMNLITSLGRIHKNQNLEMVAERGRQDQWTKNYAIKQRAQSSILTRFKNQQDKRQTQKISSGVNMINKVSLEKLRDLDQRKMRQTAQSRVRSLPADKFQRKDTSRSRLTETSTITAQQEITGSALATPEILDIEVQRMLTTEQPNMIHRGWQNLSQMNVDSNLHNVPSNIVTQRLEQFSNQASQIMGQNVIEPLYTQQDSGRGGMMIRNVVMSKQSTPMQSTTRDNNHCYKETLLIDNSSALQQQSSGINMFGHANLPINYSSDYDPAQPMQQQQQLRMSHQGFSMPNLSMNSHASNFDLNAAAAFDGMHVNNTDENYQDFLNQQRKPLAQQFRALPVKTIHHHNRDIQSDLHTSQQITYQKQLSSQLPSQQSSQSNSYHKQLLQQINEQYPIAMPVTMKEYQLQLKKPRQKKSSTKISSANRRQ